MYSFVKSVFVFQGIIQNAKKDNMKKVFSFTGMKQV